MARARMSGGSSGARPGLAGKGGSGSSGAGAVLRFRNRSLSTFRGTVANAYGDETDVGVPYLTGVPCALAETTDTAFNAATQRQEIVRSLTATVPAWADIVTTDTLQDETTGLFYEIDAIEATPGIGYYPAPKVLTLKMRSGVSIGSD